MNSKNIKPDCQIELVTAADLIDGLDTIRGRYGQGIVLPPPGKGPDEPLGWAIQEVTAAAQTADQAEIDKLCTNAVINSRRSLSCLVDWYLDRDLAKCCKNPPNTPKQQATFLMKRGIIDDLTSHVLERAVEKRNRVEHDYVVPKLSEAEDSVELLRRTISTLRDHSDPSLAPLIYGLFLGGHGYGKNGPYAEFGGWSGPLAIFCRFPSRPWVGLLIPDTECKALLRQSYLDQTNTDELIQLLYLAEQRFGNPASYTSPASCRVLLKELGIVQELDMS